MGVKRTGMALGKMGKILGRRSSESLSKFGSSTRSKFGQIVS